MHDYDVIGAAIVQLRAAPQPRNLTILIHPRDPLVKVLGKRRKTRGALRRMYNAGRRRVAWFKLDKL
jgi:hypothetical protein